jgi:hypothetical protein
MARLLAEDLLDTQFYPPFAVLAIEDRLGNLRGAAILNDFADQNIELTCVGEGAFSRDICKEIANAAFNVNGAERITIRTRRKNERIIQMALRWGWKIEGILRRWYGDDDAVVMGMLREEATAKGWLQKTS